MINLIKQLIKESLNEVRYVQTGWKQFDKEKPIRDDEVIRVYHGFYSFNEALYTLLHGLSGKERARRIYSYESGNNPKGLFVSINFDVVKRNFAGSGVIIEFSTKVSDLEAPVWVGGRSYFVQGEYTQSFKDDEEREQQRLKNREREAASPYPQISQSDRPELAQTLFDNPERQALYIGDLNPNMIKYVWYNETLHKHNRTNGDWVRYTRKDFINKFKNLHGEVTSEVNKKYSDYKSNRLFKPNDDFNPEIFKKRLEDKWEVGAYERWLKYELDRKFDEYYLKNYFWPKQMKQAKEYYTKKFPHLNENIIYNIVKKTLIESDEEHSKTLAKTGFWGKQGAGSIVLSKSTKRLLIPLRSNYVQEPNTWGVWGGAIDSNENPQKAAIRELTEEAGYVGNINMIPLSIFEKDSFKYYNFLAIIDEEFTPKLDWETQSYGWLPLKHLPQLLENKLPQPLHFGLKWLLEQDLKKIMTIGENL